METIRIEVDGLGAIVSKAQYEDDPDSVIASVRQARADVTDLTEVHQEFGFDYDSLVETFGEDDETEVDDAGE